MSDPLAGGQNIIQTQVVEPQTGRMTRIFTYWMVDATKRIQAVLTKAGQISSAAVVSGRQEEIGVTLGHLNTSGKLDSLTNVAADVNLDHIADTAAFKRTTPDQVTAAQVAHNALVASSPSATNALVFDGIDWLPGNVSYGSLSGSPTLPANTTPVASEYLTGYDSMSGSFNRAQPSFTDISGNISPTQGPAGSGTITIPKLTVGGTNGSITVTNGFITSFVNPT